jgi:hypothetical protein
MPATRAKSPRIEVPGLPPAVDRQLVGELQQLIVAGQPAAIAGIYYTPLPIGVTG